MKPWTIKLALTLLVPCVAMSLYGAPANADITQTLDSVDVSSPTAAEKMRFYESRTERSQGGDFYNMPVTAANNKTFLSCQRSPNNRDFVCIENDLVRSWADAEEVIPGAPAAEGPKTVFSCKDTELPLIRQGNPCTVVTLDTSGNIWLGGLNRKNSHSVIKAVPVVAGATQANCPAGFKLLTTSQGNTTTGVDYCAAEYATGRPILEDIVYVGGEVGADFVGPDGVKGPGVLLMENKLTVSFLPDPASPVSLPIVPKSIGQTRSDWNLSGGGEDLQGADVLQRDVSGTKASYVVVTTNRGRVLAKKADGLTDAFQVFDVIANRKSCNAVVAPKFRIRTRYESGRVYVSDRDCKQVQALEWDQSGSLADQNCVNLGGEFSLCNAQEYDAAPNNTQLIDVTLSTGLLAPTDVTVTEGVGIDFNDCTRDSGGLCVIVADGTDGNAIGAQISNVTLVDRTKSGMAVYRITGIPDCRYPPHRVDATPGSLSQAAIDALSETEKLCYEAQPIRQIPDPDVVEGKESLDVSGLLPLVIQKLFNSATVPTALPEMLISPLYRAQANTDAALDRTFEAFFGRTEEGVYFRQTFDFQIDIKEIATRELGCGGKTPGFADLHWDVITTISERHKTASSPTGSGTLQDVLGNAIPPSRYVDMLTVKNCQSPSLSGGSRWSLYPYNLEFDDTALARNRYATVPPSTYNADQTTDAFANLLVSLYDELGIALDATARQDVDGNTGGAPLSTNAGRSLKSSWENGLDKLKKCVEAGYYKKSAADQTCQGFSSQVTNFRSSVVGTKVNGTDKANRLGELIARSDVILYVLRTQFLPSIPANGFYYP